MAALIGAAGLIGPVFAASAPPPAAQLPAAVSAEELQRLVNTLESGQDRAKLVEQLRALIAAERGGLPAPQPPASEQPAQPATFVGSLSSELNGISSEILATAAVIVDAPRLVAWIEAQVASEQARARWGEVLLHLVIVFGLAVAAEAVVRWLLRRPGAALASRSRGHLLVRLALTILRTIIDLLPIAAFAVVGFVVLPLVGASVETARVAEVAIRASVLARALLVVVRGILLTANSPAVLLGATEETRTYLYIWARRFVGWAIYGYAVAEGAWWLGVPGGIYAILLKGAALVLAILTIIFVLQNRQSLSLWLRGGSGAMQQGSGWGLLRHRLAETWHILATIYVIGIYAVYALRIPGGFSFLLRATVLSVVLVVGAGLLVRVVSGVAERGFAIKPELKTRFPTLEARANRYVPALSLLMSVVIYLFAGLALLQAWGVDTFKWLGSPWGRQATSAALSIGSVLAVAVVIWELMSASIERYLAGVDRSGHRITRSARIRTLLPLLRTATMVGLAVLAGLTVLAEVGVNIAPLLAGAGIVGLAIGFGSQALVKDVINGLFILIEDTLAVGDVVDVGNGHVGTVETISIRSLRLRDVAGAVHTVPFSDVTTVKNLTRDYAYVVVDVGLAYREDPDRAIAVLKQVGEEIQRDADLSYSVLEPLEVVGVDRFSDSAIVIRVRMKTRPLGQWAVAREFNRRMKKAFDENGIEMPAVNQTPYLPERGTTPKASALSARAR